MPMNSTRLVAVGLSYVVSVGRLGAGYMCRGLGPRPARLLVLYDIEACPMCRRVREALTELDLEARIHPCPRGGTRFRDELPETGGRHSFPTLVDGVDRIVGSSAILDHLYARYGTGRPPLYLKAGSMSTLAGLPRALRGR